MKVRTLVFFLSACLCAATVLVSPVESAKQPKQPKITANIRAAFFGPCTSADGTQFGLNACYLAAGFNPANLFTTTPECHASMTPSDEQRKRLAQAYRIAPSYVRERLCRL